MAYKLEELLKQSPLAGVDPNTFAKMDAPTFIDEAYFRILDYQTEQVPRLNTYFLDQLNNGANDTLRNDGLSKLQKGEEYAKHIAKVALAGDSVAGRIGDLTNSEIAQAMKLLGKTSWNAFVEEISNDILDDNGKVIESQYQDFTSKISGEIVKYTGDSVIVNEVQRELSQPGRQVGLIKYVNEKYGTNHTTKFPLQRVLEAFQGEYQIKKNMQREYTYTDAA